MAVALVAKDKDLAPWLMSFQTIAPHIKVFDGLTESDPSTNNQVICAVVWNHPEGFLDRYPNLKIIASMGAGVDHIFKDSKLNKKIPITRVVDDNLSKGMNEYLLATILNYCRQLTAYSQQQQKQQWRPEYYKSLADVQIGIMGLGELGTSAARYLNKLGCQISGWSRTEKQINGVVSYFGQQQLPDFLAPLDILIGLLPLTSATQNIVNQKLFAQMKPGAYFINAARGGLVVEQDLIEAITSGQLSGACLDVFNHEPLPQNHPFWKQDDILITPHIASLTTPQSVVAQIVDNYERSMSGKPLANQVDPLLGY